MYHARDKRYERRFAPFFFRPSFFLTRNLCVSMLAVPMCKNCAICFVVFPSLIRAMISSCRGVKSKLLMLERKES